MADPQEGPKVTTKSSTVLSTNNIWMIRQYFEINNLYIDEEKAFDRYPELKTEAEGIVGKSRGSVMDDESWVKIKDAIREYKDFNELTFLVNVWIELLPAVRKARPNDHIQDTGVTLDDISCIENPAVWTERAWSEDFLSVTWSADFSTELINTLIKPANATITKILNLHPRLKTPRPDLTFGLKKSAFTKDQHALSHYLGGNMQRGLYHPFLALEAKNELGTLAEAEIQCCRAGAAMVYSRRRFNQEAKIPSEAPTSGADPQSFVFTVALIPLNAEIYIHWAEVGVADIPISYHMNSVGSYHMKSKQDVGRLRQAIYNILDWGLFPRKQEIFKVCETISELHHEDDSPVKKKRQGYSL